MAVQVKDFNTLDVTTIPSGPTNILKDKWFWCVDGDATKALFYRKYSPQCNSNKAILDRDTLLKEMIPTAEIVFVGIAFCPLEQERSSL